MKPVRTYRHAGPALEAAIAAGAGPGETTRSEPAPTLQPEPMRRNLIAKLRELRDRAQARAVADAEVIAARFRKQDRAALRRFAAVSFAHCEVAEQFPMLAFTLARDLATPARRAAAEASIAAGEPLNKIARAAGVPMWTRALPPMACEDPGGKLPESATFACKISALLQKRAEGESDLRGLLRLITHAYESAGEELALWLAYRTPEKAIAAELPAPIRMLELWYLLSQETAGLGRELIHTPWRNDLSLETALRAVKNFTRRIELELMVGPSGLSDPWFAATRVMDLEFVPLLTSTDVRAEAKRNCNCLDWYGQRLATNEVRLYSVRNADGACVANVEISGSEDQPRVPRIAQIKAPGNEAASSYAAGVADIWLRRQMRFVGLPDMKRRRPPAPDPVRWREIVEPLANSGRLPSWARRAPSNRDLFQIELEFTMLGCRLHTRGWRFA